MVLFLNIIVPLFILGVVFFSYKKKSFKVLFIIPLVLFFYAKLQPSYLPKGDITRTEVPAFEKSNAEIKDNNRKPIPSEIRNAAQEESYRRGLSFIE